MVEKVPEYRIVSCIVLFGISMKAGYVEWSTFYVLGLLGRAIKNYNVMDHVILSIIIAYSVINDCM